MTTADEFAALAAAVARWQPAPYPGPEAAAAALAAIQHPIPMLQRRRRRPIIGDPLLPRQPRGPRPTAVWLDELPNPRTEEPA